MFDVAAIQELYRYHRRANGRTFEAGLRLNVAVQVLARQPS